MMGRYSGPGFIADGAIEIQRRAPGQHPWRPARQVFIDGMNGIAEAVRQVRGSAVNQVDAVEHVLVTAGTGVPTTSCLILGK